MCLKSLVIATRIELVLLRIPFPAPTVLPFANCPGERSEERLMDDR
jgi:hypothetical protein